MEVLFVCSGNIIRSPLAAGLLKKILADIGVKTVIVSSAGTLGLEGLPADREAIRIARERGYELREHRSRGLSARDVERADLILVMETSHLRTVGAIEPSAAPRTKLLTEFEAGGEGSEAFEVIDPIGGSRAVFLECFEVIDRCVVNLAFDLKYRHGP